MRSLLTVLLTFGAFVVINGEFSRVISEFDRVYGQPSTAFVVFNGEFSRVISEFYRVYGQLRWDGLRVRPRLIFAWRGEG